MIVRNVMLLKYVISKFSTNRISPMRFDMKELKILYNRCLQKFSGSLLIFKFEPIPIPTQSSRIKIHSPINSMQFNFGFMVHRFSFLFSKEAKQSHFGINI